MEKDKITNALLKPVEKAINKAASIVETIRLLGEVLRDLKQVKKDVEEIKGYLARQEEIAKVMIEQGNFDPENDPFLTIEDDDIDDKDMN